MWFKKDQLTSDMYETLTKRIIDMEARLLTLETSEAVFRNKVLRKVQQAREEPEELNNSGGGLLRNGSNVKGFRK